MRANARFCVLLPAWVQAEESLSKRSKREAAFASTHRPASMRAGMRMCVRASVRASLDACVRACVLARVRVYLLACVRACELDCEGARVLASVPV